jgi:type I restriction enzyme S subunit
MKKEYRLSQVAKIDRVPANDEERRLLPYVGLDDIAPESGRFSEEFRQRPETMLATKVRFTPKHILYGKLRPYLNKVALPNFEGVCTTEILPILPDEKIVEREYLYALLLAPKFVYWASANVSGANLPRIAPDRLAEYRLDLPPLPEQERISEHLRKAKRLLQTRSYVDDISDKLLQATFLEMFGSFDDTFYPFEELAHPGRGSFVNGPFGSNLLTSELRSSGVPVIYIRDIVSRRYTRVSSACVTEEKAEELSALRRNVWNPAPIDSCPMIAWQQGDCDSL